MGFLNIDYSGNTVVDEFVCPLTGRQLTISKNEITYIWKHFPEFADKLLDEFNSGEPDCNVIMRNTIVHFFTLNEHMKNDKIFYILLCYILPIVRCPRLLYRTKINPRILYMGLTRKGFLTEAAYRTAPPDFKYFLEQLRDSRVWKYPRNAGYIHNCALIINRLDNFADALDDGTQHGAVAKPRWSGFWAMKWTSYLLKELIAEGLIVLNPPQGGIVLNPDLEEFINQVKENRVPQTPGKYVREEDLPNYKGPKNNNNNNENKK